MPRENNDDDKRQHGDEDNNERRKPKKKEEEKKKEDRKKKQQRKKKAARPALTETPANLGLNNLFNVKEEDGPNAGSPSAPPINVAPLFATPEEDAQRRLNDALLAGDDDDEDADVAVDYDEDVLQDSADEGMEVDPPCNLLQEPSPPTLAAAPLLPSPTTQVPRIVGLLKAGEISEEPAQPWVSPSQRQGPPPSSTRTIGCQADFGRETLCKRLERLVASRARYAEIKRKRKLETEAQRQPEAANSSSAAQVTPAPSSEVQRPAFMQAKRPRIDPPGKSPPSGGAEVPGGKTGTSQQRGGKSAPTRGGKSKGTAGQAAKDQRVVVVLPPQVPAAKTTPPTRDDHRRSRSPLDRNPPRGVNQDRNALPQRPLNHHHHEQRHRSASKSSLQRKEQEIAAKEKEERRYREPLRRRSPSPRPSSSRHHSLPRSMPSLATGNAEEIQWMVAAMTAAFTASQQMRNRHRSSERRSRSPSPRHPHSPSPSSSSHRPRSFSRKGKGPGRGKGGRR